MKFRLVEDNELVKRAKYHKKKQKGLGAFVKLDAGNPEYNANFFNHAMGSDGGECADSGVGMGEGLRESDSRRRKARADIRFANAPIAQKYISKDFCDFDEIGDISHFKLGNIPEKQMRSDPAIGEIYIYHLANEAYWNFEELEAEGYPYLRENSGVPSEDELCDWEDELRATYPELMDKYDY